MVLRPDCDALVNSLIKSNSQLAKHCIWHQASPKLQHHRKLPTRPVSSPGAHPNTNTEPTAESIKLRSYLHPTSRIAPLLFHHVGPWKYATPATSHTASQLRARPLYCLHVVERTLRSYRLAIAYRRRALRIHGARVPARRPAVSMESGPGYAAGGDCGVQCEGQGYPNCTSGG